MPSGSAHGWLSPSTPASACCGCPSTPPTSTTPSSESGACSRMRSRRTGCTAASRRWSARPSASSLPVTSRPRIRSLWQLRHSPRLLEKHAFSSPTCLDGEFYALKNSCPHQAARVCLGRVVGTTLPGDVYQFNYGQEGRILRCPWHSWEYDITT